MRGSKAIFSVAALVVAIAGCTNSSDVSNLSPVTKEVEAKESVGAILFDQRTYYIENQAFTTSASNLRTLANKLDTPNYIYKLKAKPNQRTGIAVTATPKRPNLRSFTGVVFAVNAGKQTLTISEICETTEPSKQPPAAPSAPRGPRDVIRCPVGSRSAIAVVAQQ
ncbi:MAG: type IV pilin-like G/H family protein [Oscillatoriales cyanobacterium C42_A2020_001]|nr:type IV pilin-like G/H family protein [Leptolyngbyaceae cyanobacterium C42_A2020_001]